MTSTEWQQAKELLVESSTLAVVDREAYLTSHCADLLIREMVGRFLRGAARAPLSWLKDLDADAPELDEASDIVVGSHVGPYTVVEPLGRGGMGQVFLALDTRLRRKVALKCVVARRNGLSDHRERLTREARAAATINHPNVATIHDVIEHDGRAFIVMEYVEGESLAARLRREPLSIASAIEIGRQLAAALDAAHQKGIVHRDLKPANVQVKTDGTVKVLDFGIAKALPAVAPTFASGETTTIEILGSQPGTPGYMSPEQMMGRNVDQRSDLFSLGVILYELVTGHRPLTREPLVGLHAFDALSDTSLNIPAGVAAVVVKLLAFDPSLRFQSAPEVELALSRLDSTGNVRAISIGDPVTGTTSSGLVATTVARPGLHLIVKISIGISITALVVAAGYRGWIWPVEELLTVTKPIGGTIRSAGITCGTIGSDCLAIFAKGDPIELEVHPDAGYAFTGFTGDCVPTGRTVMSKQRTCGARFEPLAAGATAPVWRLTITPSEGGTVITSGGIQCGTMGSTCSDDLPAGVPVTLHTIADIGFNRVEFTGECGNNGRTMMTGPRTCAAVFAPANAGTAQSSPPVAVRTPVGPSRREAQADKADALGSRFSPASDAQPQPTPAERADVLVLFEDYCSAMESLDPAAVQRIYPAINTASLENQFRQYKSLACTITRAPEFIQLEPIAGIARVELSVKNVIQMRSGGPELAVETIIEAQVSQESAASRWKIDALTARPLKRP